MIAGITEILRENSALTTLIGHTVNTPKIFPLVVSEGVEPPYLAVSLARTGSDFLKREASTNDYPTVNINVHAKNYDELESVAEAVRDALDNVTGTTDAGYEFTRIWFTDSFDRPDMYNPDRPTYPRSVQFGAIVKR